MKPTLALATATLLAATAPLALAQSGAAVSGPQEGAEGTQADESLLGDSPDVRPEGAEDEGGTPAHDKITGERTTPQEGAEADDAPEATGDASGGTPATEAVTGESTTPQQGAEPVD